MRSALEQLIDLKRVAYLMRVSHTHIPPVDLIYSQFYHTVHYLQPVLSYCTRRQFDLTVHVASLILLYTSPVLSYCTRRQFYLTVHVASFILLYTSPMELLPEYQMIEQ